MNFEWFDSSIGTPIISIASYGLTFSRGAVQKMGTPEYVMLGFDKNSEIVGIQVCDGNEKRKVEFASKERGGNVRINSKSFIRFIFSYIDNENLIQNRATRFIGKWDSEQKLMTIDLKKPLDTDDEEDAEVDTTEE